MSPTWLRLWADVMLGIHFALVLFMLSMPFLVVIAARFGRPRFALKPWVRVTHLLVMTFIVGQSLSATTCPLTTWESQLREAAGEAGYQQSFIADWMTRLMFFNAPPWVFTSAYCLFFAFVLWSWWRVPCSSKASTQNFH
jgi:hypothetical protein